ncbi:MAG TPA: hypothetical protein PLJ26_00905 [Candidatus Omnitrophota bacterium]|nr:hypothetical protein [Candidatus Omnitrophota bacterium]HQJ15033.1 hypothetical protein [Candidatus Omnitrophota bacterium]
MALSTALSAAAVLLVWMVILFDLSARLRRIGERLSLLQRQIPDSRRFGLWAYCGLKGTLSGMPFVMTVTSGGNRSRPKIVISCRQKTPFKLIILHRESQSDFFTRLAHVPVMSALVKTNDPYFDERFSIYSHNTTDIAGYFYNTGRKDAVRGIFELGYNLLEFKGTEVTAQKYEYDTERDLHPDALKAVLGKVIVLAKGFRKGGDR